MTHFIDSAAPGDQGLVVVGVDGSPSAQDAVDWAAAEASARQRSLHLVHAFIWPLMGFSLDAPAGGPADGGLQAAAEHTLEEAEKWARSAAPDIKITSELVVAGATSALLARAQNADVIVVGSRGLDGFSGLLVGSVGVALAAHAPCPVIVVHPRPEDRSAPSPMTGRIVVGVDGEPSAAAIGFAFQTAARRGAALTAVHVWAGPAPLFPDATAEDEERQRLLDALEAQREKFPEVKVEVKLVSDHAGRALVEESADADLVVVGSRGRGGFRGLLLGSVSQAVLHHAQGPVAVVRSVP